MKMKAWLVYDQQAARRNASFIQMHQETGRRMQIDVLLLVTEEIPDFVSRFHEDKPDFVLMRTRQPELTKQLEGLGIPVFNNSFVAEICNDKGKTSSYVRMNSDVPVIPTECFDGKQLCRELMNEYPHHVVKAVDGHGGNQVFQTSESWERIRTGIGSSDFVIQPLIRGIGKDIRFYVIGRKIIGAVERKAVGDFRANFSLGGRGAFNSWGEKEERLVHSICELFSFGFVGIDFIVDEKGHWLLNEIEDVAGARMLYQCQPKIRLLEQYFAFILEELGG